MKDEIKEILDELKAVVETKDYENGLVYIEHSYLKAIHYYITNLQEENSEQLDENLKLSEWLVKKQKRIEKAREYIEKSMNNPQPFYEYLFGNENGEVENLDKLLNILNGGDE